MKCPYCSFSESKVVDSRETEDGVAIRRRRECESCKRRYTTYEKVESMPVLVIKNDGRREIFDASKIKKGMIKACEKRPVSMEQIDKLVNDVEKKVNNSLAQEIPSKKIGEMVMDLLKSIDDVAYVRFASVHREFTDIEMMYAEIEKLVGKKPKN